MRTPVALLRLRWLAITNAWRYGSPSRRLWLALIASLGLLLPLALRFHSADLSLRALAAVASFDALPALLLTAWIVLRLLPRLARLEREDPEEWLVPRIHRPCWRMLLSIEAMACVLLLPAWLMLGIGVLSSAGSSARTLAHELNVSLAVACVAGVVLSWMLADTPRNTGRHYSVLAPLKSGRLLLATLPLAVFSELVTLRRILWLAVPVMLSAEVGASFNSVLTSVGPWLLGVGSLLLMDSIRVSVQRLRGWIPAVLLPTAKAVLPATMAAGAVLILIAATSLVRGF